MAGGMGYEGQEEENDGTENGRWWEGVACWVVLMMSEGCGKGEQIERERIKRGGCD